MMNGKLFSLLLSCLITLDFVNAYIDQNEDSHEQSGINFLQLFRSYGERERENRRNIDNDLETWTGRWMPERLGDPTPPPKILSKNEYSHDDYSQNFIHSIPMGIVSTECDDAKTNLTIDWDGSPVNYTCYNRRIIPNTEINPMLYCEEVPTAYVAAHKCMNEKIEYDSDIPIYGTHRALWPVYGEYKFLPKQRWLHSMEHGAVVMLYHPCANPLEVKRLKSLIKGCLRRHIITPYNLLEEDRMSDLKIILTSSVFFG
uniref:uncharacterized protein LOC127063748 isoform X3 n=1 Tax=Vespula vulgaris TaxID=7454 RepID=UPI00223BFA28|nr:uncharacterized protein LOC127063748 isoform X3 [Vespula vulgaris]